MRRHCRRETTLYIPSNHNDQFQKMDEYNNMLECLCYLSASIRISKSTSGAMYSLHKFCYFKMTATLRDRKRDPSREVSVLSTRRKRLRCYRGPIRADAKGWTSILIITNFKIQCLGSLMHIQRILRYVFNWSSDTKCKNCTNCSKCVKIIHILVFKLYKMR